MKEPENNKEQFKYSYSAPTESERKQIEDIRKQYVPTGERQSKIEQLKALDDKVKRLSSAIALVCGIVGVLVFGLGMSMSLVWNLLVVGITVSVAGVAIMSVAYPVYKAVLRRNKAKYGEQILRLSEDLLNEDTNRNL